MASGPIRGKRTAKKRAVQPGGVAMPPEYKPPTPMERLSGTMDMAAHQMAMDHPQTQRLKTGIHKKLMKTAKSVGFGSGMPTRNVRSF